MGFSEWEKPMMKWNFIFRMEKAPEPQCFVYTTWEESEVMVDYIKN